jgi:N-acylneuraminate cytidylyltransferase
VKSVILIPARGGSKGIPKKNLQKINSQSLVEIKIAHALVSQCGEVFVSTDDKAIAEVSRMAGAKVIERPSVFAKDESSTEEVLLHAAAELELKDVDILTLLQVTSPLMRHYRINQCFDLLMKNPDLNSVITLRMGHPFMWKLHGNFYIPHGHERKLRPRRQDLPRQGWENGACYSMRVGALMSQKSRFPEPTAAVECTYAESLDIDDLEDLEEARNFFRGLGL